MTGPQDALLVVEKASYSYLERFAAINEVTLAVQPGEKVALLGANGCGKSTVLKVLDGLVFPDSGRYTAFDAEVTEDNLEDEQFSRAFRSRIGFVFQNSDSQVFSPTVREEIAFGPLNMGLSRDEATARVDDTLAMLDIADLADRAPYQLSGGQKKRVAIASVLVMNPQVLLFDEPTAALDPRTQHWLVELIIELNAAGKTIVVATHDLDALEDLADRCVVLSQDHRVAADGPTARILADEELLVAVNLVHRHAHSEERRT
ncbi:MAG TPA: ABC transporter ATP-binding protein [Acidimicrobiia bacterium]|jgi:cobalt/nickel transport system ATP-binding protein|nr:ABC transporter ATP-binding protein [Acidimicrobiia bacterium]